MLFRGIKGLGMCCVASGISVGGSPSLLPAFWDSLLPVRAVFIHQTHFFFLFQILHHSALYSPQLFAAFQFLFYRFVFYPPPWEQVFNLNFFFLCVPYNLMTHLGRSSRYSSFKIWMCGKKEIPPLSAHF